MLIVTIFTIYFLSLSYDAYKLVTIIERFFFSKQYYVVIIKMALQGTHFSLRFDRLHMSLCHLSNGFTSP